RFPSCGHQKPHRTDRKIFGADSVGHLRPRSVTVAVIPARHFSGNSHLDAVIPGAIAPFVFRGVYTEFQAGATPLYGGGNAGSGRTASNLRAALRPTMANTISATMLRIHSIQVTRSQTQHLVSTTDSLKRLVTSLANIAITMWSGTRKITGKRRQG